MNHAQAQEADTSLVGNAGHNYRPRIYVACLASYHHGLVHGRWIDADQPVAELADAITAMLADSPLAHAEDWAIHDHHGFAGFQPHEHEALEVVSRVARGITAHGEAFAAYVNWAGTSRRALAAFLRRYKGTYPDLAAWGREMWQRHPLHRQLMSCVDPQVWRYISVDYKKFAGDLAPDWHIVNGHDGTHVFAS